MGQSDHHLVLLEILLGQGGQTLVVLDQQEADERLIEHAGILSLGKVTVMLFLYVVL
jgi:hypothetical protein